MTTTTTEVRVTKCGDGTVLTTTGSNGTTLTIRVVESHHHKTPSCYMGKTFVLTHKRHTVSVSPDGARSEWDVYTATFKNGSGLTFTHWLGGACDGMWDAKKENAFRCNWVKVEVIG